MRRVVITGMGIYSCIGVTLDEVEAALRAGRSGIGVDPARTACGFRSPLTGIVKVPDLKDVLERHKRIYLAEQGKYAYVATKNALADALISEEYLQRNEVGVLYGNDSCADAVIEGYETIKQAGDTQMVGSASIFRSMNSTVSMNLAMIFSLKGISLTVSAACASGAHAIGLGAMCIRSGMQDMLICGGAQEINPFSMSSFDGLGTFSVRTSDPARASRPFDASRDGLVPSGGAATVILEEYEHAVRRGAKIYAEIAGYGFSSNGGSISKPCVDGAQASMLRALADAGVSSKEIDYINAHATSTVLGDAAEAEAIQRIFGPHTVPVSSTKSMTGHECWMAGASETIYTVLMMKGGFIAPNINFEKPDQYTGGLDIVKSPSDAALDVCLSNSFGFGGTNSTLVVKNIK